jgi:hypothetical protein
MKALFCFKYPLKKRDTTLLIAVIVMLITSLIQTQKQIAFLQLIYKTNTSVIGDHFALLKDILEDTPRIGYYTDKSIEDITVASLFGQAQYVLLPVLLELNALDHPFVIFDYKDTNYAIENVLRLGMIPIMQNSSGTVLAKKPDN